MMAGTILVKKPLQTTEEFKKGMRVTKTICTVNRWKETGIETGEQLR